MTQGSGTVFDPDTIALLKKVLAEAEQALPNQRRSSEARVKLATGILEAAAKSETLCDYERPDLFRSKSDTPVPLLPPHQCGKRGGRTVDVRPNWKEPPPRESLTWKDRLRKTWSDCRLDQAAQCQGMALSRRFSGRGKVARARKRNTWRQEF